MGVSLKSGTYHVVKFDVSGFELLVDVSSEVVRELRVRETEARVSLGLCEVPGWLFRNGVERHRDVLSIANLLEVHMRDFLDPGIIEGVVRRGVPWQLGEV
jgi:hypothetical protein